MPALNIIHPGLRVFMQDDQEPAVPGTTTPASVGTATASGGRSSIERNSEDDIGSGGKASGRGRKRVGLTAGGAGATRKVHNTFVTVTSDRLPADTAVSSITV